MSSIYLENLDTMRWFKAARSNDIILLINTVSLSLGISKCSPFIFKRQCFGGVCFVFWGEDGSICLIMASMQNLLAESSSFLIIFVKLQRKILRNMKKTVIQPTLYVYMEESAEKLTAMIK